MSQVTKLKIVDEEGIVIGEYDIALSPENLAILSLITPYLQPSMDGEEIKNIQIASPKNINIEPVKGVKFKVGEKAQVELLPDKTGDLREFVIKAWRSIEVADDGKSPKIVDGHTVDLDEEILVKAKLYCNNLEINNYDKVEKNRPNNKIQFKCKDADTKGIIEGQAIDLRCLKHGGIAAQIAGADGDGHENKFKIETSRTTDVDQSPEYVEEGGKGIEIATINSQFTSIFTKEYRFRADSPIFAVTRGEIEETTTGKWDYPTQADDSKDVKNDDDPITWGDLIAAVKYLKGQNLI